MSLHAFLIDQCSHSVNDSCLEKAKKGRHIIESIIHSKIGPDSLLELDSLNENTRTNLLYDLLHLQENATLAQKMLTSWESRREGGDELTRSGLENLANELCVLCDSSVYETLIIYLLSIELDNDVYDFADDTHTIKYKTLLKKHSAAVTKQWIDEGYYHACKNKECEACESDK